MSEGKKVKISPVPMDDCFGKCPYATVQKLISGKWAMLILHNLEDGPVRFNDLQRQLPKMTHATLSVQLKNLIEHGLVIRRQYESIPPWVEYSLSEIGQKFHPVLEAMEVWGKEYISYMKNNDSTEEGQV
jgi:DNA-binding HxlR family transcriptional regulator